MERERQTRNPILSRYSHKSLEYNKLECFVPIALTLPYNGVPLGMEEIENFASPCIYYCRDCGCDTWFGGYDLGDGETLCHYCKAEQEEKEKQLDLSK